MEPLSGAIDTGCASPGGARGYMYTARGRVVKTGDVKIILSV